MNVMLWITLACQCAHSHMLVRVAPHKPALRSWPCDIRSPVRDWAPKWIAVDSVDFHGAIRHGTSRDFIMCKSPVNWVNSFPQRERLGFVARSQRLARASAMSG
uniref:Secreted protein n=1 Tax=Ananas comosus var. bracteatus TaxID=296719 RepID=A0A6V7P9I0_ANACO|nr:unnamed protein product [Ananas comosus var. bracteatus]